MLLVNLCDTGKNDGCGKSAWPLHEVILTEACVTNILSYLLSYHFILGIFVLIKTAITTTMCRYRFLSRLRGVGACLLWISFFSSLALCDDTGIQALLLASPLGCSAMLKLWHPRDRASQIQGVFASVARYILVDAPRPSFSCGCGEQLHTLISVRGGKPMQL